MITFSQSSKEQDWDTGRYELHLQLILNVTYKDNSKGSPPMTWTVGLDKTQTILGVKYWQCRTAVLIHYILETHGEPLHPNP